VKALNQYEVMYVLDTALEEQDKNDAVARFSGLVEQNGGKVERVDEWGKRRLAYAINYKTEGYYVLMYITAPSDLPRELERNLQIADYVLRYLVIRFEGAIPVKKEPMRPSYNAQHTTAAPAAPAEEATAQEEEPAAEPTPVVVAEDTVAEV
jgi:small subunit ribosomal protein S6